MSAQRHRIRRQTLEITVQDAAAAWPLQSALSRIQGQHIEPLIDRCCTEAGDPERLHRIESLEIDLGRLDPGNLERDLLDRLGPALRDALAKRIRLGDEETTRTGGDPGADSRLELVAQLARGGHLPWWADASRPRLLDEAIAFLLGRAGPSLVALVRAFSRERASLLRIVLHCADERLSALAVALLASSRPDVPSRPAELGALLRAHRAAPAVTPSAFRVSVWMGVLQAACIEDGAAAEPAGPLGFWREALVRTALEAGVTYVSLVTGLLGLVGPGGAGWPETLAEVVRRLARDLARKGEPFLREGDSPSWGEGSEAAPEPREGGSAHAEPTRPVIEIERLLLRLARRGGPFGELFDALFAPLRTVARDASTARQEALLGALRELDQNAFGLGPLPPEAAARLLPALRQVALQEWLPAHVLRRAVAETLREPLASGADSTHADELPPEGNSTPADVLRQSLTEARGEPVLAEGDSTPADVLRQSLTEARGEPVLAEGDSTSRGEGSEAAPEPREGGSAHADPADTVIEIERLLLRLARRGGPFGELFDALFAPLRTFARDASTARQEALLEALRELNQNAFGLGPLPPEAAARLRRALRHVALQEWLPAHVLRRAVAETLREPLASGADSTHADELPPEGNSTPADVLRQALTEARGEPVLAEGDSRSRGEASEVTPGPREDGSAHADPADTAIEIERLLLRLARRGGPFGELFDALFGPLRTVVRDASTARQEALLEALLDLDQRAFQSGLLPPEAAARLRRALRQVALQEWLPAHVLRRAVAETLREPLASGADSTHADELPPEGNSTPADVLRQALTEARGEPVLAEGNSTPAEVLRQALTEARSEPVLPEGDSTSRGEGSEAAPEPREGGSAHAEPTRPVIEIERLLLRLARCGGPFGELFDALFAPLRTVARDASTARQEALLEALRGLDQNAFGLGPLPPEAAARLRRALRQVALQEWLPAHVLRRAVAEALHEPLASGADSTHAEELPPEGNPTPADVLRQSLTEARGEPVLAEGDSTHADVLRQALTEARSEPVPPEDDSPSRGEASEVAPEPREDGSAHADPADTVIEIERLLQRLARRGGPFGELFDALFAPLRTFARDASAARQEALLGALQDLDQHEFQSGPLPPEAAASLLPALRWLIEQGNLPVEARRDMLEQISRDDTPSSQATEAPTTTEAITAEPLAAEPLTAAPLTDASVERSILREMQTWLLGANAPGAGAPATDEPISSGREREANQRAAGTGAPAAGASSTTTGGLPAGGPATPRDLPSPRRGAVPEPLAEDPTAPGQPLLPLSPGPRFLPAPEGAPRSSGDDQPEAVYVENAGLVVLWPFLGHLFERLELTVDRHFKDVGARLRAAGLLQHLATGELEPVEYQLPLAKVLCGLEVTDLFDFGPPVTEPEAAECTNLLTAAIANAPILGEMSIDGFRGSFLMRKGVLGMRDGAFLLRVERVTYDAVLDRFPWGMSWVKLPWMEAPLCVEW